MFIAHDAGSAIYAGENKRAMIINSSNPQRLKKITKEMGKIVKYTWWDLFTGQEAFSGLKSFDRTNSTYDRYHILLASIEFPTSDDG